MHGNGAADAPMISNTPRMGRDWAVDAFLGQPAAASARNRVPAARGHDDGRALADAWESGSRRAPDLRHSECGTRLGGGRVPGPTGCGLRPESCTGRKRGSRQRCVRLERAPEASAAHATAWAASSRLHARKVR